MKVGGNQFNFMHNTMRKNQNSLSNSMQKLSSGLRIKTASDDSAGLAISEKMRGQIRGLNQASRNIQDSISLIQTAEGGLNEIQSLLQRGRELSVQASNGTLNEQDKGLISEEITQLFSEITNISRNTQFNGRNLLSTGGFIPVNPPATGEVTPPVDNGSGDITNPPVTEVPIVPPPPAGNDEEKIIRALQSQYLEQAEKVIQKYYGLTADGVDLTINIEDFKDGTVAYVSYGIRSDGKGVNIQMTLDKEDFLPADGFNTGKNAPIYNDRVITHELTHAVMARTMNFAELPYWFIEGTAEFIHGADERLNGDIYWSGKASVINSIGDGTDNTWGGESIDYSAGYVAVRYLHDRIKDAGGEGIKDVMTYLKNNQSADLDKALKSIPNGKYTGGLSAFVSDFKSKGLNYMNSMNLSNADTGAIGGLDSDGGAVKNATNVIADVNNWKEQPLSGFNIVWNSKSNGYTSYMSENRVASFTATNIQDTNSNLSIQVGANAGQSISFNLSNITLEGLGLNSFDIQNASSHITSFDNAISMVSSERSRYGSLQNRLEYSLSVASSSSTALSESESRIRDIDIAKEMMNLTKLNILSDTSNAIYAQSSQNAYAVLQLIK